MQPGSGACTAGTTSPPTWATWTASRVEAYPGAPRPQEGDLRQGRRHRRPDAILATNTSSLPVTEIAVATSNPKRVVGMHFFNPAPEARQFALLSAPVVTEDEFEDVKALAQRLGKQPVVVGDKAGFIANALLFGYLNHAADVREQVRLARGHRRRHAPRLRLPDGPLALMDLIGLDTAYEILDNDVQAGPRPAARPTDYRRLVSAGLKGRKSGRGFYTYAEEGSSPSSPTTWILPDGESTIATCPISRVGVVGSGTMATGIIEVFAKAGYDVVFVARADSKLEESARPSPRASRRPSSAAS